MLPLLHRYYGLLRHPAAHPNRLAAVGTGQPETTGLPRFLGDPLALLPGSVTPVGPFPVVIIMGSDAAPAISSTKAPDELFSFEANPRLRRSLPTLRSWRYHLTTHGSLPAGDQPLPDGIGYPQDP